MLGDSELAQLGEIGERHHDEYVKEANRLVQQMFVEHVRGTDTQQPVRAEDRPLV